MSAIGRLVEAGREAGLLDETGALTGRALYRDVPVQGANGTRVNPADVRATIQQLERSKTTVNNPVAIWYKGRSYYGKPGWTYYYEEAATDNGDYHKAPVRDGSKVRRWLVKSGYRLIYSKKGRGEAVDFAECWMHERYAGYGDKPDDFHPKSTAEIREYIALALKTDDDAPSLEAFDAPVQQPNEQEQLATTLAARLVALGWVTGTTEAVGASIIDTLTL